MSKYCVTGLWEKDSSPLDGFAEWASGLAAGLEGKKADLALIYWTPDLNAMADDISEDIQLGLKIPVVAGCSVHGLVHGECEFEEISGVQVSLFRLPKTSVKSSQIDPKLGAPGATIPDNLPFSKERTNSFLCFINPESLNCDGFLSCWNKAYPGVPMFGGLAARKHNESATQIYLNGRMTSEGGIVIGLEGDVALKGFTAQGCQPIGSPSLVTKKTQNIIEEIGNRPAFKVLAETLNNLPSNEQNSIKGNLFMGLAFNEYKDSFKEGDFLIRNLLEADPVSGCLGVAAEIRTGQTVQFQKRDAEVAGREINAMAEQLSKQVRADTILGGLMFNCVGRGAGLFMQDNHDTGIIHQWFESLPLGGFFSGGEIGPAENANFLHSYSSAFCLLTSGNNPD